MTNEEKRNRWALFAGLTVLVALLVQWLGG